MALKQESFQYKSTPCEVSDMIHATLPRWRKQSGACFTKTSDEIHKAGCSREATVVVLRCSCGVIRVQLIPVSSNIL